jgi:scytalone dehydratase
MPLDDYIAMCKNQKFLGDPCTMTQHLVGASYFERISETEVIGHHQVRAAHQVYTAPDLKEVRFFGHAQATNLHWYKKIDEVWKIAGLRPKVLWGEGDFGRIWDRGENGSFWQ